MMIFAFVLDLISLGIAIWGFVGLIKTHQVGWQTYLSIPLSLAVICLICVISYKEYKKENRKNDSR